MLPVFHSQFRLGVLGGGQLGRMLIEPALRLDIRLGFLDRKGSPCQESSIGFREGDPTHYDHVVQFGNSYDALTIEIENVNTDALFALLKERNIPVYPSSDLIRLVQDKLTQKQYYQQHCFPTVDFIEIDNPDKLKEALAVFSPGVLKLRRSGYDGQGVQVLTDSADLKKAFTQASIFEPKIDFQKEIAIIAARTAQGQMVTYPIVEMHFHPTEHLLEYLIAPADLPPSLRKKTEELACDLAESLQLVGILAIEFFISQQGELLINEIAPRPHNSGHYSLDACIVSQFEQHLRAIRGLPLGNSSLQGYAATFNLLGDAKAKGPVQYEGIPIALEQPNTFLHLYGKLETRPFRKMGHINILAPDRKEIQKQLKRLQKLVKVTSK